MEAAKQTVSQFLGHGNKHTVDIEQETKPAVLHETVSKKQHEKVTTVRIAHQKCHCMFVEFASLTFHRLSTAKSTNITTKSTFSQSRTTSLRPKDTTIMSSQ